MIHNRTLVRIRASSFLRYYRLLHELAHLAEMETQYQAAENMDLPDDRLAEWWNEIEAQRVKIRLLAMNSGKRFPVNTFVS